MLLPQLPILLAIVLGANHVLSWSPFDQSPRVTMHFCSGQREGDKNAQSHCDKMIQQINDTINANIKEMTNRPELPDPLFKMDLLPDTLLPISTNSINPKDKRRFAELCTKAFHFAEGRDPSIAVAEERNLTRAKEEFYQHRWCELGHDQCGPVSFPAGEKDPTKQFLYSEWKINELSKEFESWNMKQGLLILGNRLIDEMDRSEDIRDRCLKNQAPDCGDFKSLGEVDHNRERKDWYEYDCVYSLTVEEKQMDRRIIGC